MPMPMFAHTKLKPLRQTKGLSQAQIAAELAVSRPTYVLIEHGEKEPTITQLYTLARLLGVEPGELCTNLPGTTPDVYDYAIFKEMVRVCAAKAGHKDGITKTKLATLVYLADFAWYRMHSAAISGATYRHGIHGPVGDDFLRALDDLYEAQSIALEPQGTTLVIRTIEQPSSKLLNPAQQELLEAICAKWGSETTEALIRFVSQRISHKLPKPGATIPYESILNEPTDSLF